MLLRTGVTATLCTLACLLGGSAANAATLTVTTTQDNVPGSLRSAVEDAQPGETIVVPAGEYTLTSGELRIEKALTILGAGAGKTFIQSGGHFRVMKLTAVEDDVTISGVTIRHGLVEAPSLFAEGGGVYNKAYLTLEGVVVAENSVDADGTKGENGGDAQGGGIYSVGGTLKLSRSKLTDNGAFADGGEGASGGLAQGGGLDSATRVVLDEVAIEENEAFADGGHGPSSVFQRGGNAQGGGFFLSFDEGSAELSAVTINENSIDAAGGPGGVGGEAEGGGAMVAPVDRVATSLVDATIAENGALAGSGVAQGGGLMTSSSETAVHLTNSTLNANETTGSAAGSEGGNLYVGAETDLLNTIVGGGIGPAGSQNCGGAKPGSQGHNIDSLDECGFDAAGDKVNVEPLLEPLGENGGFVQTEALPASSPAVGAGADDGCPATDARGVPRPQGAACDIGAFERAPAAAATDPATGVSASGATLQGSARNSDFLPGSFYFEWGTSIAYGHKTAGVSLAPQLFEEHISAPLTGLQPRTTYHFRAVALGSEGNGAGADASFTTATPSVAPAPPAGATQPVLTGLVVKPSSFKAARGKGASVASKRTRRGATIAYDDSEAALTTLTVLRVMPGFRAGASCLARPPAQHRRRPLRCTRHVRVGAFTHADAAGATHLDFTGRIDGRALAVGRYLLQALARNAAGQLSRTLSAGFRVIP